MIGKSKVPFGQGCLMHQALESLSGESCPLYPHGGLACGFGNRVLNTMRTIIHRSMYRTLRHFPPYRSAMALTMARRRCLSPSSSLGHVLATPSCKPIWARSQRQACSPSKRSHSQVWFAASSSSSSTSRRGASRSPARFTNPWRSLPVTHDDAGAEDHGRGPRYTSQQGLAWLSLEPCNLQEFLHGQVFVGIWKLPCAAEPREITRLSSRFPRGDAARRRHAHPERRESRSPVPLLLGFRVPRTPAAAR